jgi:DeoR/GlpR family transcriptional regulator of sugar metabolism
MRLEQRHRTILELLVRRGYVSIEELAAQFRVTPQTIRSDINALSRQKLSIARAIARDLPDRASIFMTLGTAVAGESIVQPGETLTLGIDAERAHLFDVASGRRLRRAAA